MSLTVRLFLVLTAVILIALPLTEQPQIATAKNESDPEPSAYCRSVVEPGQRSAATTIAASLRRFAGEPVTVFILPGLVTSESRPVSSAKFKLSAPVISGLPAESGPLPARFVPALALTVEVNVANNAFAPRTVRISAGDTVRWTWTGSPHSVTSGECGGAYDDPCQPDGNFCSPSDTNCPTSPPNNAGFVYSHQFNTPGTYLYYCNVHAGIMTGTVIVDPATATPTIQLSAGTFSAAEGGGAASIAVSRSGATTSAATVNYATSDTAGLTNCSVVNGVASSRCDYPTQVGTVRFAAGESSKTISIPTVDDSYAEGNENFTITLSNPTGGNLGSPTAATVTLTDNEGANGPNPIDGTPFFVRQHYIDFLNREPDPGGSAAWQAVINNCPPNDTTCDRIHVSSSFFRSPEFQERGYFVYRFYPVSFGRKPDYVEFTPDIAKVSGFLSDTELEAAKVAFITEFMNRPAFITTYNGLNDTQYVDTLLQTAAVAPHQFRDFWIAALGNGTRTRATVLRDIAESPEVYNKYYNQAFVVMQYFGYLRRDPDALYTDWIAVLNSSGDYRGMIFGFMFSTEYRARFGP